MCGITGIWHLDNSPLHKQKLTKFTDALTHRGPDGGGYFVDEKVPLGLGHRRLSILDLSENASQPMPYADNRYWIAFNGEIFNFLEIRDFLITKNYTFKTESDTEVVLASYHFWGEDCLKQFNGMWAMAIWDTQEKSLFLARDRFGIKPLYFLYIPDKILAFASETYAFKFLENYNREWDDNNLQIALHSSFDLEGKGHTTFKNTYQILGGHFLKIEHKNPNFQQKRWWNTLENLPEIPKTYKEQVEKFYEIFENASLLRLRADVPIASALSGGVDSSAVYCMLKEISKNPNLQKLRLPADWQEAFVATFPDTSLDERQYAEEVINFTKGKAHYIIPDYKNLTSDILESTKLFDNIIFTPLNIVSDIYKAMHQKGFKISMDGHGVDEMLLGYPHFSQIACQTAQSQGNFAFADDCWDTHLNLHFPETQKTLQKPNLDAQNVGFAKKIYQNFVPEFAKNLYRNLKSSFKKTPPPQDEKLWFSKKPLLQINSLTNQEVNISHLNPADKSLYEAFHLTILPSILRNFDRASMQNSMEIRMPFMDYRLVSYVFALPLEAKIGGGFTKRILRDAMKDKMPESIRTRKLKIGLNAPMIEWFSGQMSEFLLDEIHSQSFLQANAWNGKNISEFAQEKIKQKSWNWEEACRFWTVINAHILMK